MFNTTRWRNPLGKFLRAVRDEQGLSREALVSRILWTTGYRITANHYFRIEQGIRTCSADALDQIADGLELNHAQREYAFSLIPRKPPPMTFRATVPAAVRRVVELQQPIFAHLVDGRMDVRAWNDTFCELYGFDLDAIDEQDRNIAWLMFSHPNVSARLRDWEIHAQTIAALCRSQWAGKRYNEIQEILQRLMTFPQFATWWNQPRVSTRYFRKEIDHPDVGLLVWSKRYIRSLRAGISPWCCWRRCPSVRRGQAEDAPDAACATPGGSTMLRRAASRGPGGLGRGVNQRRRVASNPGCTRAT